MLAKYVPPSVAETAFNCLHCGALTTQFWSDLFVRQRKNDDPIPQIIGRDDNLHRDKLGDIKDQAFERILERFNKIKSAQPFVSDILTDTYKIPQLYNVFLSKCYNCKKVTLWVYDKVIYPSQGEVPPPNPDLPDHIAADYREASSILSLSPRGAAAIIRLCIQNICAELGQSGRNINDNIREMVAGGLDIRVQRALDAVRVIGNNAVHPGQIDLKDDRATAESLFRLLNLIAEKMISEPKHVDEVYSKLPPEVLAAIAKRDEKNEP